jgi:hypothetical protein
VPPYDALSAQLLALVQAVSALTASADDLATRRAQEQLLQPAARTIEVKKPEENKMVVQTSGGQLRMYHSSSVSDLGTTGEEQKSDRIKLEIFARVCIARKLRQKSALQGLCKAVYLQKVTNFNWNGSKIGPPAVWTYYCLRYGTSHGSVPSKKPAPQIQKPCKKTAHQKGEQLKSSAAGQNKAVTKPAPAQGSVAAPSTNSSPPATTAGGRRGWEGRRSPRRESHLPHHLRTQKRATLQVLTALSSRPGAAAGATSSPIDVGAPVNQMR